MSDGEYLEIEAYLAAQPDSRRARIQHFLDIIEAAEPELPRRLWSSGDRIK
jgi:hypothetical protein